MTMNDREERIIGRDLKITEGDIFVSLPFFRRVRAFLFGGVFGVGDPQLLRAQGSQLPRIVVVCVPSIWKRFYYKRLYRLFYFVKTVWKNK